MNLSIGTSPICVVGSLTLTGRAISARRAYRAARRMRTALRGARPAGYAIDRVADLAGPGASRAAIDAACARVTIGQHGRGRTVGLAANAGGRLVEVTFPRRHDADPDSLYRRAPCGGDRSDARAVIDIANPFGPGRYLLAFGGSNTLVSGHVKALDTTVERFRPWRGQSCAVDLFGLRPRGLRASGWRPADPAASAIFGAGQRAPCDATGVAAEVGMPDLTVPNQDPGNRLGNPVILRCGGAEIVLAQMRQGSVTVAPGERAALGDRLGEVGNSGASTEPHLHLHAQRPAADGAAPISGAPLASGIDGRFPVRGDRIKAVGG